MATVRICIKSLRCTAFVPANTETSAGSMWPLDTTSSATTRPLSSSYAVAMKGSFMEIEGIRWNVRGQWKTSVELRDHACA